MLERGDYRGLRIGTPRSGSLAKRGWQPGEPLMSMPTTQNTSELRNIPSGIYEQA